MKLRHLSDDELRNWAKQYAVKSYETLDRETLLGYDNCILIHSFTHLLNNLYYRELNPFADGIMDPDRPKNNLPLDKPTFTLKDIQYSPILLVTFS